MLDHMLDLLQSTVGCALPDRTNATVSELASISVGWESDVYAFDVESGPPDARQSEALVLRIYPGADAHTKSEREFQGMRQLFAAGYPVPRVLALERDASPFGKPFMIMERVEGKMMWEPLFRSPVPQQSERFALFCDLLVRLHRLDWRPFVDDPAAVERSGPYAFVDRWLAQAHNDLARFRLLEVEALVDWLEVRRDRVACTRPAPVHLDFHPANLLLRADGSATVIDWTQIQVSDPRFDLAWTLILVGAAEGWAWRDRILAEYERLAGAPIEELELV